MWQPGQQQPPQQQQQAPPQQQQQQMMMPMQMQMQMQQQPPQQMYQQHAPGQQPPPGAYAGMTPQPMQQQPPPWAQPGMPPGGAPAPWAQPGAMPQVGSGAPPWNATAPAAAGGPAPWEQQQPPQQQPPQQQQPLPQQQPPVPTKPPADGEYAATIKQLAGYVNKNGADFEKMIRDKQSNNPKFSFLFGGDGHEYYRWCKHAASLNLTDEQVALQVSAHQATQNMFNGGAQANAAAPQAPPAQPALTDAQASEFKAVLASLSGAKPYLRHTISAHSSSRCTVKITDATD
jgi:hypothetical protein